jgi:lipopolysaccharide/colanic/teichoic acid biosynthesis glycosyltransferase
MEPEILASPTGKPSTGVPLTAPGMAHFPAEAAAAHGDNGQAVAAVGPGASHSPHAPVSGNGHTAANGHGVVNGHASPYAGGRAVGFSPRLGVVAGHSTSAAAAVPYRVEAGTTGSVYIRQGKRCFDILGAAIALVVTSPLLLIAALAIRLESRGPILYRSTRIGRGGRPFTFLKLRSMVNDADRHRHRLRHLNEADGPVFKISNDPRVTRVGRFLRITSIDEIPQFVNVLRGDMSLVGPRPPIPEEVEQYEAWQLRRLDVRPGITCLWQISGRSRIGFQEWMRLDLEYIRNQSFALDLKILLRTIPAVLSREGAY